MKYAIESFGVAVDVEVQHRCMGADCGSGKLGEQVCALLPPGYINRDARVTPKSSFLVECRGLEIIVSESDQVIAEGTNSHGEVLHVLDGAIRSVVAQHAPDLVFVHAGVVAIDGVAIVFPGRSMAGKTTLVESLVRSGALYLSDEYAVFDSEGLVHPYPRRLSIRGPQRSEVHVESIGGTSATGPMPVGLVAAIAYRSGATWSVHDQSASSCALALIDNAIAAQTRSSEVLKVASAVARDARCVAGERGEVKDSTVQITRLL